MSSPIVDVNLMHSVQSFAQYIQSQFSADNSNLSITAPNNMYPAPNVSNPGTP